MKFGDSSTEIVADTKKLKRLTNKKNELLKMASSLRNGR